MTITSFRKPALTPTQRRVEAIVKAAAEVGMGGFALANLRTAATEQIEPLAGALDPFAKHAHCVDEIQKSSLALWCAQALNALSE